ncbi:MAG TPA: VOC family protein [Kofleriaceae bacterium]|nr:VOC family protein [Kofleriaceae bacterium]
MSNEQIIPYLAYADAPRAIDFLCKAFGFAETFRFPMDDGRIGHAELALGDRALYLASLWPEMGFASPKDLPGIHCQVYCIVDDVDAHHARARAAGATIATPPADTPYGERSYRAVDPEGHRWIFASKASS